MVPVAEIAREIINEQGRTQSWVWKKMNEVNPDLNLNDAKMSAILTGRQTMTAEELLAICVVLEVDPDRFVQTCKNYN